MKVKANISLAIAIDYTSSMTDDIDAVKENVIELLTNTVGSTNEPADYVLSLFHDPGKMYFDEFYPLNLVNHGIEYQEEACTRLISYNMSGIIYFSFQRVFSLRTYVVQSITRSFLVIYVLFFGLRHFELRMAEYT